MTANFISKASAARRGLELVNLKEAEFFRILPNCQRNADKSRDCGFRVGLYNRAGYLTGFAQEAA